MTWYIPAWRVAALCSASPSFLATETWVSCNVLSLSENVFCMSFSLSFTLACVKHLTTYNILPVFVRSRHYHYHYYYCYTWTLSSILSSYSLSFSFSLLIVTSVIKKNSKQTKNIKYIKCFLSVTSWHKIAE